MKGRDNMPMNTNKPDVDDLIFGVDEDVCTSER